MIGLTSICLMLAACGGGSDQPSDPLAQQQWHITGESEGKPVVHLDVVGSEWCGRGVVVGVVDDGIDIDHEDLAGNVLPHNKSYLPETFDFKQAPHGTAVAGLIAARARNGLGGTGVAPCAKLIGYNVLRAPATANFADALTVDLDRVDIYNNSWGDFNGWGTPLALKPEIRAALEKGTTLGRGGKGAIYVFSAGNGAQAGPGGLPADNVNYSGLVNNRYTIPVCAVDANGRRAPYSEKGATLWVCAPSNSSAISLGVVTTDASGEDGYNSSRTGTNDLNDRNYTRHFGGTSAAAPMVAAVAALVLEASPHLGWRDLKAVLALSAARIDPDDADWQRNAAGLWVNHAYGFGLVQAGAAVRLAQTWQALPATERSDVLSTPSAAIPDDGAPLASTVDITADELIEFVEVEVNIPDHGRLGDLEIVLIAPTGTRSVLAEQHYQAFNEFRLVNWPFGSVRHLGERSRGRWTLQVRDLRHGMTGTLAQWRLRLHTIPGRQNLR